MKKWFYVDVELMCRERIAVKAKDEEQAKDIAGALVDSGTISSSTANKAAYGSVDDSIAVAERKFKRPPKAMRKFDGCNWTMRKSDGRKEVK
jgi:hypothetical protein